MRASIDPASYQDRKNEHSGKEESRSSVTNPSGNFFFGETSHFQSDHTAEVGRQDRGTIEEKGDNCIVKYIRDSIRKIPVQSR